MASLIERIETLEARADALETAVASLGAAAGPARARASSDVAALEERVETNREAIRGIDALLARKRRRHTRRSDL